MLGIDASSQLPSSCYNSSQAEVRRHISSPPVDVVGVARTVAGAAGTMAVVCGGQIRVGMIQNETT